MTTFTGTGGDDTAALQDALNAAAGGALEIVGHPLISGGLFWSKPCRIISRAPMAYLRVKADVPGDVDILTLQPDQSGAYWGIERIGIIPESVGPNPGRHGLVFKPGPTGYGIGHFEWSWCHIDRIGGHALHIENPGPITPPSNALFNSVFRGGSLSGQQGSVYFRNVGDSVTMRDIWCHGPGLGIYAENIPGAAQCVFNEMSIVNEGGAACLKNCNQLKIRDTQSEQSFDYTGSDDAMYTLDNCVNCEVTGTNMNTHGRVRGVVLRGASGLNSIDHNTINVSAANPKVHVHLEAGVDWGNNIGAHNNYMVDGVRKIDPWLSGAHASPQFGVWTAVPLSSGWAAHGDTNYYTGLQCQLNGDRGVTLRGTLVGGTNTVGTVVGTMPVGARPSWKTVRATVRCKNAVWADGQIEINAAGQIKIAQAFPATSLVAFDGVRFATY